MKAIVCTKYGPPEVLQLKEVGQPIPKKNEICIKIHATSVTASDCIIRGFKVAAKHKFLMGLVVGFRKPRKSILGMVYSGEIESIGSDVRTFKKGQKVMGFDRYKFGAYGEYKCVSEKDLVVKLSQDQSYKEAAAIPYGGLLALHFLKKADVKKGQNVLVYGASGAVGTSAVQLAKYFGAKVTGVCSTKNLELVKSLGADKVLDYTQDNFTIEGAYYDLVFNAVGKQKVQVNCENILARDGKHLTVDDGAPKFKTEDLLFLNKLMVEGQIRPVIDKIYPLEQIVEAHTYVDQGHKRGNVIVTIN